MTLSFPSPEFNDAVAAACHGIASEEQLHALHALLRQDPAARDEYLFRIELHSRLASNPDLFASPDREPSTWVLPPALASDFVEPRESREAPVPRPWAHWQWAMAAGLALMLGIATWLHHRSSRERLGPTSRAVAMLNRVVQAQWNPSNPSPRLGTPLEPGPLRLESGWAQIVFYNGARVVIEGPAEFHLRSSSEALLTKGKLTAEVPPQARGFRVLTPRLDVTDLGTSFGLSLAGARTELHVFEGDVEFKADGASTSHHLTAGTGTAAEGTNAPRNIPSDPTGFASLFELQAKSVAADARRYDQWREANQRRRRDPSLWIHFDFEHSTPSDWRLSNAGALQKSIPDATIVGCQWQEGRWATKPALEFRGVSDRVRLDVPGTCDSVSLATWVRVQGLDRPINSLFMSDGFASGTVHWVVRNDGVLGLTVIGPKSTHQILPSPPVLTIDQFGIWTHLAVVLDGPSRRVTHYINGQAVSQHAVRIAPPYRIGPAELGNWNAIGFPGNDPFLIRNFSGVMDEFCLFSRALSSTEIRTLYSEGKPQADALAALPQTSPHTPKQSPTLHHPSHHP